MGLLENFQAVPIVDVPRSAQSGRWRRVLAFVIGGFICGRCQHTVVSLLFRERHMAFSCPSCNRFYLGFRKMTLVEQWRLAWRGKL